jgi:hypothetical protein
MTDSWRNSMHGLSRGSNSLYYDAKFKYLSSINPFDGTQKRKIYGGAQMKAVTKAAWGWPSNIRIW